MSKKDNDKKEVEVLDDEKELVLDHNYDGIKELDHPLPAWWVFIFIATIVFAIPYYFYYTHASGPSIRDEMKEELAKIYKIQDEYEAKQGDLTSISITSSLSLSRPKNLERWCLMPLVPHATVKKDRVELVQI